ncbi:MAG: helix-turn-helix domain-containing protein [Bacilli bacterium]|jgi:DNA-binding protein Fis|nr:helix-turn-helix domain-containing protein [Bacilli bacterium]
MKRHIYIWTNNKEKKESILKYLNKHDENIINVTTIYEDILFIEEEYLQFKDVFDYHIIYYQFTNELKTDLSILFINDGIFNDVDKIIKEFFLNTYCDIYDAGGLVYYFFVLNDDLQYVDDFYSFLETVDDVLKNTVFAYLDNNLNSLQTAKDMYIHRNTLSYRLNRFEFVTGINIRTLRSASMIHSYRIRHHQRFIKKT